MTNALLIHNNNTPLKKDIDNQIVFNPTIDDLSENDIDGFISKIVMPQIKEKEFQIIYIKDNLSVNYLDFYGLILAYHIRFELGTENFVPIVILSEIDAYTINRLTPLGAILFTKNLFLVENSLSGIDKFKDLQSKAVSSDEYRQEFLNKIEIEAPKDYLSHHDISNEWAIYRWAEFLKITDSQAINQNREKIASMLYFKYLLAKNPVIFNDKNSESALGLNNRGKVLLIDDEWDRGWGDIFKIFFALSNKIDFLVYNDTNKNIDLKSIDVIILDLRMTQEDHNPNREIGKLTGVEYAQKIKKANPGIQIIMFTATGRSLILEELHKYGILGYIKKEHPTDNNMSIKESFNKLVKLVDTGLEKKYLKKIWDIQNKILKLKLLDNDEYIQLASEVKAIFNILNSDMKHKFNYALFGICKCLETIKDNYFAEENVDKEWKAYWKGIEPRIYINGYSTSDRLQEIIKKLLIIDDDKKIEKEIKKIFDKRNRIIHPKNNSNQENIDETNLSDWFTMLKEILISIDEKERNALLN